MEGRGGEREKEREGGREGEKSGQIILVELTICYNII